MRFLIPSVCLLVAAFNPIAPSAQSSATCSIAGTITSGRTPLPGVVVSALDGDGRAVDVSASGVDGAYGLKIPGPGRYTLNAEFVAFATVSRELSIELASCQARLDLTMTLASRAPKSPESSSARASGGTAPLGSTQNAGEMQAAAPAGRQGARGQGGGRAQGAAAGRGQAPAQQFQSLELLADQAGLARTDENGGNPNDAASQLLLPAGFSPDTSTESVTSIGSSQANAGFFGPNGPGDFADRFGNGLGGGDSALVGAAGQTGQPGRGGPGGPGGFAGGRGGFGGPFGGRGGRGNQIRGSVYQSMDSSVLDTAPFALNGQPTIKPDYFQQRLGATLGGPLVVPHIVNSPRTFFFLNYTGNHSRNPYDAYSTVPTLAERGGDLSAIAGAIVDPLTGQPFVNNQIPASRINPTSQKLLTLFPAPNQDGTLNYHTVTTTSSELDDINVRFVQTFGAVPQRGGRGGGGRGAGGGGRGGPGAGRAGVSNLNVEHSLPPLRQQQLEPSAGARRNVDDQRVGHSRELLVHEARDDAQSAVRLQPAACSDDEPVRQQRERCGQCRRARRVLRSLRLGRAEPVVQQHRQRPRHQSGSAHRPDHRDRRHHHEDPRQADSALRRRLQEHPGRQPDRSERARQLRLHGALQPQRFCRLPARHSAAGERAVQPRPREFPLQRPGICSSRTTGARATR